MMLNYSNNSKLNKHPDIETFSQFDFEEMNIEIDRLLMDNDFMETELHVMESYGNHLNRYSSKSEKPSSAKHAIALHNSANMNNSVINSSSLDASNMSISNVNGSVINNSTVMDNTDSMSDHSDGASSVSTSMPSQLSKKKFMNKRRQKEQMVILPMENKIDIVHKEIEDMRIQIDVENKYYEREIEKMRAEFLEADLEIEEIDKENGEFRRDILLGARNERDDSIIAEKIIKYFEDGLKQKDTMLDKLRLKNDSLKVAIRKARSQLEQREDMGEVLSKIDFDQMKIENEQLGVRIEERNNELLRLKLTTGKTMSQLTSLQRKLNNCVSHKQWLKKQIDAREKDLQDLKDSIEDALKEKENEEKKNSRVKKQHEQVDVPQIIDYVHLKKELDRVRHEVVSWERKVEIGSKNEKIARKKYHTIEKELDGTARDIA